MQKKTKIVLLGGSNSIVNGLQKGLRQENVELTNLALGSSISLQNLYELKRERNQEALKQADLIITESNINEIANHHGYSCIPLSTIITSIHWLYEALYHTGKKIVILLLPFNPKCYSMARAIDNAHRECANQYGFNLIDMQSHFENEDVFGFYGVFGAHQMARLMSYFGEKIVKNFHSFQEPKEKIDCNTNLDFKILTPKEMIVVQREEDLSPIHPQNSAFCEDAYSLRGKVKLQFPKDCEGWKLLAIHAWNNEKPKNQCSVYNAYSSVSVRTRELQITKSSSLIRLFNTLNIQPVIDECSFVVFDETNSTTEKSEAVILIPNSYTIPYFNLIDFFLVRGEESEYAIPSNEENVQVESRYNFNHLIPNVKVLKEIIEEYCAMMDSRKQAPLRKQIATLQAQIKMSSAKERVKSHLAYKLGSALILNSKSLWGIIRLPYVLSYIQESHKQEQKQYQKIIEKNPSLKLPPLESYADYQEALKIKNYTSYKLGEGLIAANLRGGGKTLLYLLKAFVAKICGLKIV